MKRNRFHNVLAFTLIELLAVMMILGLIVSLALPVAMGLMTASHLTQGTDFVVGQLKYARQLALTENKVYEVRFYKYADPSSPGSSNNIRAVQLWRNNPDGTRTAVNRLQRFPGKMIVSDAQAATALGDDQTPSAAEEIKNLPSGYRYKAFQYRPDGSTTLTAGANYFTLVNEGDVVKPPVNIPANFSAIQIEVLTGAVRVFRP